MRVAVGELWHETNSFSPVPTTGEEFRQYAGDAVRDRYADTGTEVGGFIEAAGETDGVELVPLEAARAVPGGPVDHGFFESFTDRLLAGLDGRDVDGVLLSLHGSMVTDGEVDPEGTLLGRVREAVGDRPVVASLDHHANVTGAMVAAADALVAYREHPHTGADMRATGRRAAELSVETIAGRLDPAMAMVKAPTITATRLETDREPMRSLFAERERLETGAATGDAVAAASLCPVHPYLDVPEYGFAAVVVTDGRPSEAAEAAGTLARSVWARRSEFDERLPGLGAVLDRLLAGGARPTALADRGDVTLAGAPGDSPVVLRALLERPDAGGITAAIPVVDRPAAETLFGRDGETARVSLGGSLTPAFDPVEVDVAIEASFEGPVLLEGSYSSGSEIDMGRRVVVRVIDREPDVRAIVSERPGITTDPSFFSVHGIDPAAADLLVVKSIGTFRPGFEPIAGAIEVADTPGLSAADLSTFDYRRARPIHPIDDPTPSFEPVGDVAREDG